MEATKNVHSIIHTACKIPKNLIEEEEHFNHIVFPSLMGTKYILESALKNKVKRFIWTGSMECIE